MTEESGTVPGDAPPPRGRYHHGALREALVRTAESLLEEVGPDRMTLRETARRAGVSHAAPAHHFGDLGGLLTEVAAEGFEKLSVTVRDAVTAARDAGEDSLSASGQAYVGFAIAHPGLFQLMFRSRTIDMAAPRLAAAMDAAFAAFADAASPSQGTSDKTDGVQRMAGLVRLWSMAHGFAFLAIDNRLDDILRATGTDLRQMTDAVLAPPPEAEHGV